ncbi:Rrf2 family transcriptional regulator [Rhodobaculum claviforme]|uniref:BadM/Rrf2 family transcriptional regulator n=1 Tax=Rhodobaculum claviforme TaxID=1549854 RepID=A0A934WJS8_9RHOB|nr:BadM/Rrf2 family transcriptional regulator [Rhodobaculum claviforme]
MRLTKFSDYALRVLLYAASRPGTLVTIEETADVFEVSRAHLKKVVLHLSSNGYLQAMRGRGGGFTLARAPQEIGLGALIRSTEGDFGLVECFQDGNRCPITPMCRFPAIMNEALAAFLTTLDRYTLHDVMLTPESFLAVPGPQPRRGPAVEATPEAVGEAVDETVG